MRPGYEKVLTPEAIDFAVELEREFGAERRRLLARRAEIQRRLDAGWKPDFLPETREIREGDWRVAPIPRDLQDRRVEITGPTDRKMVINALNSGANVFMADFEDANTPTWQNLIEGQANLRDAVRRTITYRRPADGPALCAERQYRRVVRAPAGLAFAGSTCTRRRRADVGRALRLRALLFSQRQGADGARHRALFLPAEAREPPRSAAMEQRLSARAGEARIAQRDDPRDRADRDDPRRLRDGRDPLGAARPLGRAQLRPLGLHLQLHQEIRRGPELRDARPRAGHDDERISCGATACC